MTGLATSSGPTLLGKLRALDKSLSATDGPFDPTWLDELADLLPQIIGEIERDAKDGRWHAITADRLGVFISQRHHRTRDEAIAAHPGAIDAWRNTWEEPARGAE